jgi:hypothetical protein
MAFFVGGNQVETLDEAKEKAAEEITNSVQRVEDNIIIKGKTTKNGKPWITRPLSKEEAKTFSGKVVVSNTLTGNNLEINPTEVDNTVDGLKATLKVEEVIIQETNKFDSEGLPIFDSESVSISFLDSDFVVYNEKIEEYNTALTKLKQEKSSVKSEIISLLEQNYQGNAIDDNLLQTKLSTLSNIDTLEKSGSLEDVINSYPVSPWMRKYNFYWNEDVQLILDSSPDETAQEVSQFVHDQPSNVTYRYEGIFNIPSDDTYLFYVRSDDAGAMWLGSSVFAPSIDNATSTHLGFHSETGGDPVDGEISLESGKTEVLIIQGNSQGPGALYVNFAKKSENYSISYNINNYITLK